MNCSDIRQRIRDEISHETSQGHDGLVVEHIEQCEICRILYADAVLERELKEMPVPEPRDDFSDRVIKNAVKRNRTSRIQSFMRMSAAAILIIAAGMVLARVMTDFMGLPGAGSDGGIVAALDKETTVRVMIETVESRQNATFSICLAGNIALKNYPEYRKLSWQVDLTEGRNLLELPIIYKENAEGYVNIRYRYNGKEHEVRIPVLAEDRNYPPKTVRG